MVISRTLLFSLLYLLSISACSKQNQAVEAAAFQKMMDLQEEVRPHMSDLNQLSSALEKLEVNVDSTDRQLLGEIDLAIRALEKADQSMMAWINVNAGVNLEELRTQKSHQEIMQYLEVEQQNLNKVQNLMQLGIAQAEKLLNTTSD